MAIGNLRPDARTPAGVGQPLPSGGRGSPTAAAATAQEPDFRAGELVRTTSAPEAGNPVPQPRRSGFPRYGSSTIDDVRGMMARGQLPGLNRQLARPPVPQQSLARQVDGSIGAARDPLAWRQGLRLAAAAPDALHLAELRTAARALEAELTSEMGRRLRTATGKLELHLVAALVQAGADVAAADAHGRTPLHVLAAAACTDDAVVRAAPILRILVARGGKLSARDVFGATPLHLAASPAAARLLLSAQQAALAAAAPQAHSPRRRAAMASPGSARLQQCAAAPAVAPDQREAAPVTAAAAAVARHAGKRQRLEAAWLATLNTPLPPPRSSGPRRAADAQAQPLAVPASSAAAPMATRPDSPAMPRLPNPPLRHAAPGKAVPRTAGCPAPIRPAAGCAALQPFHMCGTAAAMQSLSLLADIPGSAFRIHSAQAA